MCSYEEGESASAADGHVDETDTISFRHCPATAGVRSIELPATVCSLWCLTGLLNLVPTRFVVCYEQLEFVSSSVVRRFSGEGRQYRKHPESPSHFLSASPTLSSQIQ